MVTNDPRHLPFGMFAKRKELPGMEVGVEVAVMPDDAMKQRLVEPQREVVEGEPEHGDAKPGRHRSGNLQQTLFHETGAWGGEVHIASWDEGGIERGVIDVALLLQHLQIDGEHTGLAIALDLDAEVGFEFLFRKDDMLGPGLEMIAAMRGHLVTFVDDASDDVGCIGGEVGGAEESGPYAALLQAVEDACGAEARHLHRFVHCNLDTMFARYVVLLGVEAQHDIFAHDSVKSIDYCACKDSLCWRIIQIFGEIIWQYRFFSLNLSRKI